MEGLPSDIFDHDIKTFPLKDSAMEAKLKAQMDKAEQQAEKEAKRGRGRPPKSAQQPTTPRAPVEPSVVKVRKGSIASKTQKIRLYFHYLSHKITFPEPKNYPQSHEGLDEILDKIEIQLHGEGGIEKASVMYVAAAGGLQKLMDIFNPLGWDLNGPGVTLQQAVAANEEKWKDLVKEFAIENASWFMFGPTKRLILTTLQLILAVDAANKMARARGEVPTAQQPAPTREDLEKEGADL